MDNDGSRRLSVREFWVIREGTAAAIRGPVNQSNDAERADRH